MKSYKKIKWNPWGEYSVFLWVAIKEFPFCKNGCANLFRCLAVLQETFVFVVMPPSISYEGGACVIWKGTNACDRITLCGSSIYFGVQNNTVWNVLFFCHKFNCRPCWNWTEVTKKSLVKLGFVALGVCLYECVSSSSSYCVSCYLGTLGVWTSGEGKQLMCRTCQFVTKSSVL